ncbi:MAG: DinB family protein [Gemmataceae bacterium]|nr:DinB family protein [Gemmataceae bacterium]
MRPQEVLKKSLASTQWLLGGYLADLADADLQIVPVPGMNTIAWQLGHLIASEKALVSSNLPHAQFPPLPPVVERLAKGNSAKEYPQGGDLPKSQLLDLFNKVRSATIAAVEAASDTDLEKATVGPLAPIAPKVVDLLLVVSNHTMMHGGQFTAARRALGKPTFV